MTYDKNTKSIAGHDYVREITRWPGHVKVVNIPVEYALLGRDNTSLVEKSILKRYIIKHVYNVAYENSLLLLVIAGSKPIQIDEIASEALDSEITSNNKLNLVNRKSKLGLEIHVQSLPKRYLNKTEEHVRWFLQTRTTIFKKSILNNIFMKTTYLLLKLVSLVLASICFFMHEYNSAIFMEISAIYMQQEQMMLED